MGNVLGHIRHSLRMLAKHPGLTFTVLFTLALGIGANTAIFTVDYATLLAPLPYPHPDQLVVVWSRVILQPCGSRWKMREKTPLASPPPVAVRVRWNFPVTTA